MKNVDVYEKQKSHKHNTIEQYYCYFYYTTQQYKLTIIINEKI